MAQDSDFPVSATQHAFTQNLLTLPTSSQLWAARQKTLPLEDIKLRQRKPGQTKPARVSRPDFRARLARIALRVNSLQGAGAYRFNDLEKTVEVRRQAAILK